MNFILATKQPIFIAILIAICLSRWNLTGNLADRLAITIIVGISQWLAMAYGHWVLTYFHQEKERVDLDLDALVMGNIFLGAALSIIVYFLNLTVTYVFSFLGFIYLISDYLYIKPKIKLSHSTTKSIQNLVVITFALAVVSIIEIDALTSLVKEENIITFKPWTDYFIHSANAMMMTGVDISAGRYEAAGEAKKFYHFGSYMLPALLIQTGLADALSVMTSLWTPLGALLAFIGMFSLSKFIWGKYIAILAVATLLLLPDASYQVLGHSFFGFQWLLQASPGCYWGLALFSIGLRFLLEGLTTKQYKLIILAFLLAALMPLFRAQFSILTFSFFVIVSLIYYPDLKTRYRLLGIATSLILIVGLMQVIGPHIKNPALAGPSGSQVFLSTFVNPGFTSNFYGLKTLIPTSIDNTSSYISASIFIIIFISGFGFVLYPASILVNRFLNIPLHYKSIPLIFGLLYIANFWYMPINSGGNPYEMTHRVFLIFYSLVGLWVSAQVLTAAQYYMVDKMSLKQITLSALLLLAFLISLSLLKAPASEGYGRKAHLNSQHPLALYELSIKLKKLHSPKERFLDSGFDPDNFIIAVSETRSYLSRHKRLSIQLNEKRALLYGELKKNADFILSTNNLQELKTIVKEQNLRWIIKRPEHNIPWANHIKPIYNNKGYKLYDLEKI